MKEQMRIGIINFLVASTIDNFRLIKGEPMDAAYVITIAAIWLLNCWLFTDSKKD